MKNKLYIATIISSFLVMPVLAQNMTSPNAPVPQESNQQVIQAPANIISSSQYPISSINPTPKTNPAGAYYPGLRAANQLVVYTPDYGKRTETNEFGREAIVVNNVVVGFSGANSFIPPTGFVISGHGKAKNWMNKYLVEGAQICLNKDQNTIESIITPESYIYKATQKINKVVNTINEYKQLDKNYQAKDSQEILAKASQYLTLANNYLATKNYDKVQEFANAAAGYADYAFYYAVPAKPGELHGVWLRPVEKNAVEVAKTLDNLKSTGINNVFLETYYQGYTIFPSKTLEHNGVLAQKKEFQGWDPLQVWISEAHKRNMKIHVWFQTFYTGNENLSKNPNNVISVHPTWANFQKRNYNANSPMPSPSEHYGYFLDPANPEVQKYIADLVKEIVSNYDIDGLNMDYIRYPASLQPTFPNYIDSTWGYTPYARSEFKKLYGVDPACLTLTDPLWEKWSSYRQSKITETISKLRQITQGKNITISAVIFPDMKESKVLKLQNWSEWAGNNMVDAFTPLVMGSDKYLAESYVTQIKANAGNAVKIYPGLFEPFTNGSPVDLLDQVVAGRKAYSNGFILFDYAHLNSQYIHAVKARAFK